MHSAACCLEYLESMGTEALSGVKGQVPLFLVVAPWGFSRAQQDSVVQARLGAVARQPQVFPQGVAECLCPQGSGK